MKNKKVVDIKLVKSKLPKLEDIVSGKKRKSGHWVFVDPCPFCGHKGNFAIDTNKNTYICFSEGNSGSILDWLMKKEGRSWKEIFEMAGVDQVENAREFMRKKEEAEKNADMADQIFDIVYDNLVKKYKELKEADEIQTYTFYFIEFWIGLFISSDNKMRTLRAYQRDLNKIDPKMLHEFNKIKLFYMEGNEMRIDEMINNCLNHNELIVKFLKGELWFAREDIPQEKKDKNEPRYKKLLKQLCDSYNYLEEIGVEFSEKYNFGYIELPAKNKRKDIELWFEDYSKYMDKASEKYFDHRNISTK